ncbi:MAG: GAF domain-containing protein [Bacteroidetes bacterium]|nr:GAF domain-containing protein [Bacteroidota bacterium]
MMKFKLKIKHKIQFFILLTTLVIYVLAVGYISIKSKRMAFNDAIKISDNYVKGAANEVQVYLEKYLTTVKDLGNTFKVYEDINEENRREVISNIMIQTLKANPDYLAVWSTWEPLAMDNLDHLYKNKKGSSVIGNFGHLYYKDNGVIKFDESIESNAVSVYSGDYYQLPKTTRKEVVLDPYYYSYTKNTTDEIHETSIIVPIINNNQFLGVVGADIQLSQFQEIINNVKPFENSIAFLMANNGTYVANPNPEWIGKTVEEVFPEEASDHEVMEHITAGEFLSYTIPGLSGDMYYVVYAPIEIGNTGTPWSIGIAVPIDQVMSKARRNFRISILVGIIGLLILSLVIYSISNSITKPILLITNFLKKLSEGHIGKEMKIDLKTGDEIEEMGNALNTSIHGLMTKTEFAQDIGEGNYDKSIELLSDKDVLGKSLIDMRDKLKKAREEETIRKREDEKRTWVNEGLALFGDVLRQNHENLEELAFNVVLNLINYLKANQGGLFLKNDEDKDNIFFELLATYAFDRRKYNTKTIELGEGLVGMCAMEKETVYMTEIPDDYIRITSGLGGANPNSLLIVPLKIEEEVLGVLEIASFNTFEDHEIEFVEKIAQNIASTLSNVKISEHTSELLEKTQQQAEEMAAQEEEMRQNMEELQATQEEAARKTAEMEGFINALNSTSYVAEYDLNGKIMFVNDAYLNLFGITKEEAVGKHHSDNIDFTDEQKAHYQEFWSDLKNGIVKKEKTQVSIKGNTYLFMESYTPIYNEEGDIYKILKIANDISEYIEK